jgi:hypothetical protein
MIDVENDVEIYIENGILFFIAKKEVNYDLDTVKLYVKRRLEICNGDSYPSFFDLADSKYATPEAREYLTNEGAKGVSAAAFFTKNIASRLFINSYLMIHKPALPTKMFSNKSAAAQWLRQFV